MVEWKEVLLIKCYKCYFLNIFVMIPEQESSIEAKRVGSSPFQQKVQIEAIVYH